MIVLLERRNGAAINWLHNLHMTWGLTFFLLIFTAGPLAREAISALEGRFEVAAVSENDDGRDFTRPDAPASTERSSVPTPPARPSSASICQAIEAAAASNQLPVAYFTRLIWQESRFNSRAVSRAGAQGIAQFMPGTAAWRGLSNPFDPWRALPESAEFLRELRDQFGNLGLAAAAYNAGPGRVRDWLAGRRTLPRETRAYVRIVTGRSADEWAGKGARPADGDYSEAVPCGQIAKLFEGPLPPPRTQPGPAREKPRAPWGLQLVGHWSENFALASYQRLQKKYRSILGSHEPLVIRTKLGGRGASWTRVRVGADTRGEAEKLCSRLRAAGGACLVMKN